MGIRWERKSLAFKEYIYRTNLIKGNYMRFGKIYLIILFLMASLCSHAQQKVVEHYHEVDIQPLHFGYTIGINTLDLVTHVSKESYDKYHLRADVVSLQPGFHVGMVSEFRLSRYFSLRCLPGMTFAFREMFFWNDNLSYWDDKQNRLIHDRDTMYHTTTFDYYPLKVPLLIKYKAKRINNYRPYLIGGVSFHYDFSKSHRFFENDKGNTANHIRFKRFDVLYEIGVGFDKYFEFFKLSTEIKYSVGLRNVVKDELSTNPSPEEEIFTNMFDKVFTNQIIFSFHFE